jgi:pimeloyl-ACP methyl ester carboxylesterase
MNLVNLQRPPSRRPQHRGRVIALHGSGIGAGQWCYLEQRLGNRYDVLAPEHYGGESTGPWTGNRAFTLSDESVRAIALVDAAKEKAHVVGHAYGGGLALHVALARPHKIASLALYEPCAFHLLRAMGDEGARALAEIVPIARGIGECVVAGEYMRAAASFVDYWSGPGAWARLQPWMQATLARWVAKAPLEFHALMEEPTPLVAYSGLSMPVLIMRGEHAPRPTRTIAGRLAAVLPHARVAVVDGAGHMGPLTHAGAVNGLIVDHIEALEAAIQRSGDRRPRGAVGPGVVTTLPVGEDLEDRRRLATGGKRGRGVSFRDA